MPPSTSLPDRIKARLVELNLSARAASMRAGLGETAIRAILNGKSSNPGIETLQKIAAALSVPLDFLTGGNNPRKSPRISDEKPVSTRDIFFPNSRAAPSAPVGFRVSPLSVPIFGAFAVGSLGVMTIRLGDTIGFAPRPPPLVAMGREVFAFYVQGSTMAPWRQPGELVYVAADRPPSPGCHVVIIMEPTGAGNDPVAVVRRLVSMTARDVVVEQYSPAEQATLRRNDTRRILRVVEWQELLGA